MNEKRSALIISLLFSSVAGYFLVGHMLYQLPIGLAPSAFLFGPAIQGLFTALIPDLGQNVAGIVWLVASLIAIGGLAAMLVRRVARAEASGGGPNTGRRRFLGLGVAFGSAAVAVGAASLRAYFGLGKGGRGWRGVADNISGPDVVETHPEWREEWKGARIRSHRRFGRTGWDVSDIVLGTGQIRGEQGERIARLAMDRGVNYFDTSPDYAATGSEAAMGRAIQGRRDQLFIATKFCMPTGHLPAGTPVAHYKAAVEGSLARLGTDYVDLCHVHSCDSVERLMDPNVHEAFDRLKQEGKVRFMGFSSHTPNLVEVADAAIESGRFDVMMLAYHHGLWAPMGEIISRARSEQDMGVVAMKTLKGAKHRGLEDFQAHADAYSQAALKWVLSNPDVSCAVISFFELQHVDEYLHASGKPLAGNDVAILEEYDREIAGSYCMPHCGRCLDSCPEGLAIDDVLRHRMYFEDYGWEKEAMGLYAKLEQQASVCTGCSAPCTGSCPVGIPIQQRTREAHHLLNLG